VCFAETHAARHRLTSVADPSSASITCLIDSQLGRVEPVKIRDTVAGLRFVCRAMVRIGRVALGVPQHLEHVEQLGVMRIENRRGESAVGPGREAGFRDDAVARFPAGALACTELIDGPAAGQPVLRRRSGARRRTPRSRSPARRHGRATGPR
jgi:hypothetical protein